jgi:SAM-dependent methyltransferase
MTEIRERRGVFGEAADAYDAARPGFPEALVDDVIEYARLDGAPVLEVGAGTGKASVPYARRGLELTCLEPDARMAAVLRRNVEPYPRTSVVVSGFEQWQGAAKQAGLLFAAQSWHWIDPETRWTLAFDALRPGGAIALYWNGFLLRDTALRSALEDVHARHDAADAARSTFWDLGSQDADGSAKWPMTDLLADDRYLDVEERRYQTRHEFTSARLVDLLTSVSAYRILPEDRRGALLDEVAQVVDARGGAFELDVETFVYLARTRS